jgi:hypothetical protein
MRNGAAYYAPAAQSDGGELGFALPKIAVHEFGAVVTATTTGICVTATGVANGGALSATGSLVSGGVATFDVPRTVNLTSTGNNSGFSFTVSGTDAYGQTQTETITGPNNNTVAGVKAFKTVTGIVAATTLVGTVSAGTTDVFGLPWHLNDKGKVIAATVNGAAVTPTLVAGFTATGTSTATTADVRGTITSTTSDSSKRFTVAYIVNPTSKATLYGAAPA